MSASLGIDERLDIDGWKGSGASGKGTDGPHSILSYMHEQSQAFVERTAGD